MRLVTCGICEAEYGTKFMTLIDECVLRRIGASGIGPAYDSMVKVLEEPPTKKNKYAQVFARVVENELYDGQDEYRGLMNGTKYICNICAKHLPDDPQYEVDLKNVKVVTAKNIFDDEALEGGDEDEEAAAAAAAAQNEKDNVDLDFLKMPPLALVNGYFRGNTPDCIKILNRVELSMINRINLISHVTMLPSNGHYASNTTVYSILNDIVQVTNSLPNKPSVDIVAVIKTIDTALPDEYAYSPYKVMNALDWLKENNENWSDVHFKTSDDDDHIVDRNHSEIVSIPCIIASADDMPDRTSFPSSSSKSSSSSSKSSASSSSISLSCGSSTTRKPTKKKSKLSSPTSSNATSAASVASSTSTSTSNSTSTSTTSTKSSASTSSASNTSTASSGQIQEDLKTDSDDEEYNEDYNSDDDEYEQSDNSSCGSYCEENGAPGGDLTLDYISDKPKGCQEVYLEVSDSIQKPIVTQLRDLIESKLCPMERRTQTRQFAHIRTTPNFLQLAFCSIFPYGKGGPSLDDNYHIKWDRPYIKHTMMLGKITNTRNTSLKSH